MVSGSASFAANMRSTLVLRSRTIDLQLREGSPLVGGSALSILVPAADQQPAFHLLRSSLQVPGSSRHRNRFLSVPTLAIAGLSFVLGGLSVNRASRHCAAKRAQESSHRHLGHEIAGVGTAMQARGAVSPFEQWRFITQRATRRA